MALLVVSMTKWTHSKDQMPPADEEVLAFYGDSFFIINYQPHKEGAWFNYELWATLPEMHDFYWTTLPDEPEGEE